MVETVLLLHGAQVLSLVGELRAHMPHRTAKGKKEKKKKYLTSKMGFSTIVKFKQVLQVGVLFQNYFSRRRGDSPSQEKAPVQHLKTHGPRIKTYLYP